MATITPEELEQARLQQASDEQVALAQSNTTTVDATEIENATPSDLKAMGISKLPLLLLVIGNQIKNIIEPALINLIKTYIQKYLAAEACADQATIDKIIQQRNLIVNQLNKIVKTLTIITVSLTIAITFFDLLKLAIKGIDLAKIAAYAAAGTFPALLPALPNVIQKLDLAKIKLQTDGEGNAQIAKYKAIIGGAALVSSIIGGFVLIAIGLLNSIDIFLQKCAPNQANELVPISKETQDIAKVQAQATPTQNQTTYKGFIIEIELVPYTSTITRRRAIGKNQDGIILIQTELSFTTNDQTLIDELKLIIDRDNLKAY
jgi:hypothetical protein